MDDVVFDGEVAIVTGAGGGLGRSHAIALAARGARVVVNDLGGSADGTGRDESAAERVVQEILDAGGEAVANHDSVSTREGGASIVRTAVDAYGTVDILVNNAGILRDRSFVKLEQSELDIVLDVHLKGSFFVGQPAFRIMKENGYGRMIHTTSGAGLFGNFGQANYAAAKMGIVGLSSVLAIEGAPHNIHSNVIAPVAKTRLTESLLGPLADVLAPEQVTPLVVYLASRGCDASHEIFSASGGKISRVFIGLGPGWFAGKGEVPSPEAIRDHFEAIRSTTDFTIPEQVADELMSLVPMIQD